MMRETWNGPMRSHTSKGPKRRETRNGRMRRHTSKGPIRRETN